MDLSLICRRVGAPALAFILFAVLFVSLGAARALADSCPNAQFRYGYGANLPDCRAYEQASPVNKDGNNVQSAPNSVAAASNGDGVTFIVPGGIPGGTGAGQLPTFLSTRGSDGWTTQGLLPPATTGQSTGVDGWTPDLTETFDTATDFGVGATFGSAFLARDNSTGLITTAVPYTSFGSGKYAFAGASDDGSMVFFEARGAQLTSEGASGKDNLYVWDRGTGKLSLVGVLPDSACASAPCVPPGGSFAGPFDWFNGTILANGGALSGYYVQNEHAVSTDGDRAYFTAGGTGQLYLRQGLTTATPSTVQVSASQRTSPDPNGPEPALFRDATPSGSEAFFTSCEKLTDNSTAVSTAVDDCQQAGEGQDLYVFDAGTGKLTDLTPDASDPLGAQVEGVLAVSADGSYVYFVANGDLDGSGPATPGNCQPDWTGQCSLYVWHGGSITFIARLDASGNIGDGGPESDASDWSGSSIASGGAHITGAARVGAGGSVLLFRSQVQLTAYDNQGISELYRYDAASQALECVSCNPTGTPPVGPVTLQTQTAFLAPGQAAPVTPRNLSASGNQVFFETPDALLPADTNGVTDVYEWEAPGAGSCTSQSSSFSPQDGGCLYLLSTGKSPDPSYFAGASSSGDDAFFFTDQPLVGQDQDQLVDVYDARVDGGLASQDPQPANGCASDMCRGPAAGPPPPAAAATVSFAGPGDVTSSRTPAIASARVSVLTKMVRGASFVVQVKAPGGGRISITGPAIRTVRRSVSKPSMYPVHVTLTSEARHQLAHHHTLRLKLRISYTPTRGSSANASVSLTVKPALRPKHTRRARRAGITRSGGAR